MLNEEQIKTEPTVEKVVFKKKAKKNLRQRRNSDDEEAVPEHVVLDEIRERQRLRQRPAGVSLVGLALGKKLTLDEEVIGTPLDIKSGGLLNMQSLRSGKLKQVDDTYDVSIGTQFSAETNKRDEDEEMMKYIETELQKRKGLISAENEGTETEASQKYLTPEEAALQALPEHLRQSSSNRSEEMLSNQMLNGIPEVDLGIDAKIKNIEATEEAKLKLIREQQNKKDGPSHFVPTNMAVNFMQHNRFKIDDNNSEQKKRQYQNRSGQDQQGQQQNQQGGGAGQKGGGGVGVKRATDDYHYDKFKKQFRRY